MWLLRLAKHLLEKFRFFVPFQDPIVRDGTNDPRLVRVSSLALTPYLGWRYIYTHMEYSTQHRRRSGDTDFDTNRLAADGATAAPAMRRTKSISIGAYVTG